MKSILVLTIDYKDKTIEEELIAKYQQQQYSFTDNRTDLFRDSGFDLYIPEDLKVEKITSINHGIKAAAYSYPNLEPVPYYLYPRSSISKTSFRMANSVGIIDSGYRGNIIAKVDYIGDNLENEPNIEKHTRLFQICSHNLLPFEQIYIVDKSDKRFKSMSTKRGEGGFGSTNNKKQN